MSENPTVGLPAFLDQETQERIVQQSAAADETAAPGLPAIYFCDGRVVWVDPDGRKTSELPPELREAMEERGR